MQRWGTASTKLTDFFITGRFQSEGTRLSLSYILSLNSALSYHLFSWCFLLNYMSRYWQRGTILGRRHCHLSKLNPKFDPLQETLSSILFHSLLFSLNIMICFYSYFSNGTGRSQGRKPVVAHWLVCCFF